MKKVKQIARKSALVTAALWLTLAVGSVWASDAVHGAPGVEGAPVTDQVAAPAADHAAAVVEHGGEGAAAGHGEAVVGEHGAAAGHGAVHNSLSPEKLKDLGLRVMNFVALMIILIKFGAKPIGSALSGRRKQVKDDLEAVEAKKVEAERSYKEFSAKLASVEKDVGLIVEKAIAQAEIEKVKIIERAEKMAEDIKRQAQMAVANEVTAARRMLKNEIADQAAVMAEALIIKNLTADDQVKIVEDYLDKVGAIQ
ncbi:MAG: ATP synthase F0 subunit B [Proteobacteria bacterium]|nr:ATP synthase F0 subunit B [Pseudomonadota bacterium]MBU1648660.1 ATP synthase F0 subunit B [Pseudomonadota bacterium]